MEASGHIPPTPDVVQDTERLVTELTELKENRFEEKAMINQLATQLEVWMRFPGFGDWAGGGE